MSDDDPYRRDVRMSDAGDFVVGQRGGLVVSEGPRNCGQALVLWLRCRAGELPLHMDYGSALEQRLVGTKADTVLARSQARIDFAEKLDADLRFVAVRDITARQVGPSTCAIGATFVLTSGEELMASDLGGELRIEDLQVQASSIEDLAAEFTDLEAEQGLADAVDELADELPPLEGVAPLADETQTEAEHQE